MFGPIHQIRYNKMLLPGRSYVEERYARRQIPAFEGFYTASTKRNPKIYFLTRKAFQFSIERRWKIGNRRMCPAVAAK